MKKLTALFLSLSLLVCSFLFASAAEDSGEDANVTEPASEVFIDNIGSSYESLELESGIDPSAKEEIKEAIETFSEENSVKAETTTVGVTTEARETAEIQEVTTTRETAEPASDQEATESTSTQEIDANYETTESQEEEDSPIPPSSPLSDEEVVMPIADGDAYSVTVSWTGLDFTYKPASKGEWDPESSSYNPPIEESSPTWESSDGNSYATFTVKCDKADSDLTLSFSYKSTATFGTRMKFSDTLDFLDPTYNNKKLEFSSESLNVEERKFFVVPEVNTAAATAEAFTKSQNELGNITITVQTTPWGDPSSPDSPGAFD